ncbi:MAG: hypothetical protein WAN14_18390, partial [Candidatus Acidiferrales bacterium]
DNQRPRRSRTAIVPVTLTTLRKYERVAEVHVNFIVLGGSAKARFQAAPVCFWVGEVACVRAAV